MSLMMFPDFSRALFSMEEFHDVGSTALYQCLCSKPFRSKSGLWRHKKTCDKVEQPVESSISVSFNKCLESGCGFSATYSEALRAHLQSDHGMKIEKETKIFEKYQSFVDWKEEYERETVSSFTLHNTRKNIEEKVEYYNCNRSGHYESQSTGKRKEKAYGSRKLDSNCTASLKAKVKSSGLVIVDICHTHYGHEKELCHVPIPKSERLKIAATLHRGVSRERILNALYAHEVSALERKHLINRRDINNIAKAYGVIERNLEEHISDKTSTIMLYEYQQGEFISLPENIECALQKEDFALGSEIILTTEENHEILQEEREQSEYNCLTSVKKSTLQMLEALRRHIESCGSRECLLDVQGQLKATNSIQRCAANKTCKASNFDKPTAVTKDAPLNKNGIKRRRFFNTKKNRVKNNSRHTKQTIKDALKLQEHIGCESDPLVTRTVVTEHNYFRYSAKSNDAEV